MVRWYIIDPTAVTDAHQSRTRLALQEGSSRDLRSTHEWLARPNVGRSRCISGISGRRIKAGANHELSRGRKQPVHVVIQKDHVTEAKLVKSNQASDGCVIRVESVGLSSIQGVRSFSDLSVGERVYSVGTPSGLEQTLGEGLISGLRENKWIKLIQTTAPISPGSSVADSLMHQET